MQNTQLKLNLPSPLQELHDEVISKADIRLFIKRDDLIHTDVSGNKWRKLKYNIQAFKASGKNTILTFGGAFSNHIHATAAAGKELGIKTIGIIRGEEHLPLNPTLQDAIDWGMQIEYMDRTAYRLKTTDELLKQLEARYGSVFIVPEGGANELGVKGCEEIVSELIVNPDVIFAACGTATTLSGIVRSTTSKVIGVPVLKGGEFLWDEINRFCSSTDHAELQTNYHFGGYAKKKPELLEFMEWFKKKHAITLDPIYTGKMFYGLYDLIKKNHFEHGITIVALHTGGLQGDR